jgi:hypothetical protein
MGYSFGVPGKGTTRHQVTFGSSRLSERVVKIIWTPHWDNPLGGIETIWTKQRNYPDSSLRLSLWNVLCEYRPEQILNDQETSTTDKTNGSTSGGGGTSPDDGPDNLPNDGE